MSKILHVVIYRYAHQVTVSALHILRNAAYEEVLAAQDNKVDFDIWCDMMEQKYPSFIYWSLTLKLELNLLMFSSAIRTGNFQL